MWRPCDYREWEEAHFMGCEKVVCALVRPLLRDGTSGQPTSLKWVELGDHPREQPVAHEMVRFFAFQEDES